MKELFPGIRPSCFPATFPLMFCNGFGNHRRRWKKRCMSGSKSDWIPGKFLMWAINPRTRNWSLGSVPSPLMHVLQQCLHGYKLACDLLSNPWTCRLHTATLAVVVTKSGSSVSPFYFLISSQSQLRFDPGMRTQEHPHDLPWCLQITKFARAAKKHKEKSLSVQSS